MSGTKFFAQLRDIRMVTTKPGGRHHAYAQTRAAPPAPNLARAKQRRSQGGAFPNEGDCLVGQVSDLMIQS